jgi:hypothetical protein
MHGKEMVIKAVADKLTHRILGVNFKAWIKEYQMFLLHNNFRVTAEDLFHMDLAYAPPFSTTKDPVAYSKYLPMLNFVMV